ncbi:MAG: elongation factor P hydroxylase [Kangiellaceae bacterium]|nr:elongation factor P hydroxylase [Kangiellaceae bacterium]
MQKQEPSIDKLVSVFNKLFLLQENTRLKMGAVEPFYQAWKDGNSAVIFAREDYFSSALHEIAHWTIAGKERRQQDDFGYWYEPEGRTKQQQYQFEQVEIKPQAIEGLLSLACGQTFNISTDNFSDDDYSEDIGSENNWSGNKQSPNMAIANQFKRSISLQMKDYFELGLPTRANQLLLELCKQFRAGRPLSQDEVASV